MTTILLADDNAATRLLLRAQLEALGANILEAADGQAALELARAERPSIAVLDFSMPKLTGIEVCSRLKAEQPTRGIRAFVLTASQDQDVQGYAFLAGVDGFFTKGEGTWALCQTIAELIEAQ